MCTGRLQVSNEDVISKLMEQYLENFNEMPPLAEMASDEETLIEQLRQALDSSAPFQSELDPKSQVT